MQINKLPYHILKMKTKKCIYRPNWLQNRTFKHSTSKKATKYKNKLETCPINTKAFLVMQKYFSQSLYYVEMLLETNNVTTYTIYEGRSNSVICKNRNISDSKSKRELIL